MAAADADTEISERDVASVLEALSDGRFDFRTVEGISEQVDLSPDAVQAALDAAAEHVRLSGVPGPNGEPLYAPSDRSTTAREQIALAQTAAEKSVS
jgi:hypothetical protein